MNLSESLGKMGMSKSEKLAYIEALRERLIRQSRGSLLTFTTATMPTFEPAPFHIRYYNVLNKFADGKIKKLMVFMPPQHGKEISDSTPVLTPNGFVRHGDLKVGDYVFGRNGRPVQVLWVSEKVMSEYDVTFSDGAVIQCHGNHEWVVYDRSYAAERRLETKYLLSQKLASGTEGKRGHRYRFQVDANVQIQLPDADLPIHPYVLGAWLGDGTSVSGCITHHKDDIAHIDKVEGIGYSKGAVNVHKTTGAIRTCFLGLQSQLKASGLLNNKHIPEAYFNSSFQQRLELLAGLIDTDGYIYHKNGRVTFSNINRRLIDDVKRLVLSLGCRVTSCEFEPIISTSGINGKNIVLQVSFNPSFEIPCALKRKQSVSISPAIRRRAIVSIVKAKNPEQGNCIEVEGGIYLVGETLIPTHNSEGSTRRLPAYILGRRPDTKVAVVSYSAPKARKFNREIQRIIDTEEYAEIFPSTKLNASNITTVAGAWLRNADECEIVGHRGGFKTVGVGGPLTGEPVDMLIMDDIYKDAKTAWSPTVRESIEDWYDTVAETRLHNDSQQLIVFTRWHENDLAGRLLEQQGIYDPVTNPNGWVVVTYQAIKVGKPTAYDPREEGEPLWPERHNLEKLKAVRKRNSHVFESLYQQDPKPLQGLMYEQGFREYDVIPYSAKMVRKNYTDTADTGDDYLCSICYTETEDANYVTDILYTQKPMEYTETKTAEMLTKQLTQVAIIESNNGGRGFARNVEKQVRALNNTKTRFKWFHQKDNKVVRIFSKSADVQNMVYFPRGWDKMWPDFYQAVTTYMKVGKNDHDDAPDTLTGTVEWRGKAVSRAKDLSGVF